MPLQDIPQTFSSMQFWQMANPHRHCQQKGKTSLQQWQIHDLDLRRRLR